MPTSTRNLHELPTEIATVIRAVVATGEDAVIADGGTEIAVIMSIADYERLHEYADMADAARPGYVGESEVKAMSIAEMLNVLGVDPTAVRTFRD
ncbi:type II toxin-antitoxin system Phd/YefM family antitoxin [Nocardia altamirensis]|uniref:type II toxin-antitoxin system Phd/YefM family antitoxin n=1 Tax=Nocardia altamirensis TaxID=472158 RepID=UPI0014355688|nr:type II toxin-antitoxin system Phd/YefM family antitoxin [Nocardia altamirensis]